MEHPDYSKANCNGEDLNMFFPGQGDSANLHAARRICMACVIREECLEDNLDAHFGVVGGTSERERRRIRHDRALQRFTVIQSDYDQQT